MFVAWGLLFLWFVLIFSAFFFAVLAMGPCLAGEVINVGITKLEKVL